MDCTDKNEPKREDIGAALSRTLSYPHLDEILSGIMEVGLDAILNEGVLQELPVIGTLTKIYRSGLAVRDKLFIQKLITFLKSLESIPAKERKKMIDKLETDSNFRTSVGENLISVAERSLFPFFNVLEVFIQPLTKPCLDGWRQP